MPSPDLRNQHLRADRFREKAANQTSQQTGEPKHVIGILQATPSEFEICARLHEPGTHRSNSSMRFNGRECSALLSRDASMNFAAVHIAPRLSSA